MLTRPADEDDSDLEAEYELEVYMGATAMRLGWELADPRDAWKHTGETPPEAFDISAAAKRPYRTPQSTTDAFFYVVRLGNPEYLTRWVAQHPLDATALYKLWEGKNART